MNSRLTEVLLCGFLLLLSACAEQPATAPSATKAPAPAPPPEILHFYASPGSVPAGQETTLCYGVENADTVTLEPAIKAIKPGLNRCFTYSPKSTGAIKLTATGAGGEASEELVITVTAAAGTTPREDSRVITAFVANPPSVAKNTPVTLCYGLEQADSVKIDPPVLELEPVSRCFTTRVSETTTFEITATRGDVTDSESLKVTVN